MAKVFSAILSVLNLLRRAIAGALLVNALPHGISGLQGRPFPTPFAQPPGKGVSSPASNVVWSAANLAAAALLWQRRPYGFTQWVAAWAGAVSMGVYLAQRFAEVLPGSRRRA